MTTVGLVREGWDHLRAGRPLAARACWERANRAEGGSTAASQALKALERSGDLPAAARAAYRLRTPDDAEARDARDRALRGLVDVDLRAMADAFGRLAAERPDDPAAQYNRALCLAWLGSNREAAAGLESAFRLEADPAPDRAVEAGTLAEVLRAGGGAEAIADDLRFSCTIAWEPGETADLLVEFPEVRRVPTPQHPGDEAGAGRGVDVFEWLDRRMPEGLVTSTVAAALPTALASVIVDLSSGTLRLSSPRVDLLQRAEERLSLRPGPARHEAEPLPMPFLDADVWTVRLPAGLEPSRAAEMQRDWVEHYYEDLWIHRQRHGLDDRTPLAAAEASHRGDPVARARLMAVVGFREQLGRRPSARGLYQGYPFDRLRRRLGLPPEDPSAIDADDLSCAPPWEMAALDPASLDDHRLAVAVASATGLRDDALTALLAVELLRRSIPIAGPHLLGAVSPMVRRAMVDGDPDSALDWIGRARSLADAMTAKALDVWRAEILARAGRPEEALRAYRALIRPEASGASMALDGAETLLDNGRADQARPLLRTALDLAEAHGLRWTARRARERLDGLA